MFKYYTKNTLRETHKLNTKIHLRLMSVGLYGCDEWVFRRSSELAGVRAKDQFECMVVPMRRQNGWVLG